MEDNPACFVSAANIEERCDCFSDVTTMHIGGADHTQYPRHTQRELSNREAKHVQTIMRAIRGRGVTLFFLCTYVSFGPWYEQFD